MLFPANTPKKLKTQSPNPMHNQTFIPGTYQVPET